VSSETEYKWKKAERRLKTAESRIRREVALAQRDLESLETWGPGDAGAALEEAERIEREAFKKARKTLKKLAKAEAKAFKAYEKEEEEAIYSLLD
jgi:hypothetical protein